MRRHLVLLTLAVGLGLLGSLGVVACGNDKPPLTPDNVEQVDDSGAPSAPAPAAPAPTAPAPAK